MSDGCEPTPDPHVVGHRSEAEAEAHRAGKKKDVEGEEQHGAALPETHRTQPHRGRNK